VAAYFVYSPYSPGQGHTIQISLTNKEQYRALCAGSHSPSLFLQDWWLDAGGNWDVAVVKNGDKIAAVWPYMVESKMGATLFRNPVLTPYFGPRVIYPSDLKRTKMDGFEHEMITALLKQMPAFKVWHLGLPPGQQQVGLFKSQGFEIGARQTFIADLHPTEEIILSLMDDTHRRKIKKAQRDITISDEPAMLPELFRFQKATLERKEQGIHTSLAKMQQLFEAAYSRGQAALWVARAGQEVQAIIWQAWDDKSSYYLAGARNPVVKDNLSMVALLWKGMQHSKQIGRQSFDLEGSMDPGVERFFRGFGAKRAVYLTIQKNTSLIWKLKSLMSS
jgi:lipid II:glycine glycyltransferase (peptidoglycan interpeptide bridge formation enzyme)